MTFSASLRDIKHIIVWKGVSARFFFSLPPFLITHLFLETCNPLPPDPTPPSPPGTHHSEITDSMMIHWNQGD